MDFEVWILPLKYDFAFENGICLLNIEFVFNMELAFNIWNLPLNYGI